MTLVARSVRRGDAISLRLSRRAMEARKIAKALRSGRLRGNAARKIEKRMETITLEAELLWRVREKMMEISPPR